MEAPALVKGQMKHLSREPEPELPSHVNPKFLKKGCPLLIPFCSLRVLINFFLLKSSNLLPSLRTEFLTLWGSASSIRWLWRGPAKVSTCKMCRRVLAGCLVSTIISHSESCRFHLNSLIPFYNSSSSSLWQSLH